MLQLFSFCPGGEPQWLNRPPIELKQPDLPVLPDDVAVGTSKAKRRAKTTDGKFKADDPATPEVNEAWIEESREN